MPPVTSAPPKNLAAYSADRRGRFGSGPLSRVLSVAAVFTVVALPFFWGWLEALEMGFLDSRFRLLQRQATGGVVLVEIDAPSLQEVGVWPWPRSKHAAVLDNLNAAGAERVAFDLDFSSASNPLDDQRLERAIAASAAPVILPMFKQYAYGSNGEAVEFVTRPIAAFEPHVALASINVRPEADGLIRRFASYQNFGDDRMPTLPALLAGVSDPGTNTFYIDYGIRWDSIPRLSYAAVLAGRFDRDLVAGRTILIGPTAVELGDHRAVPLERAMAGPIIQVLSYESLVQGRALQRFAIAPVLVATFAAVLILSLYFERKHWRQGAIVLAGALIGMHLFALALQGILPITLDIVPISLGASLAYAVALIRKIDQSDLRLIAQGLAMRRQDAFMRMVAANNFDGILTFDELGVVTSANASAVAMFAAPSTGLVGQFVDRLDGSDSNAGSSTGFRRTLGLRGGPHEVVGRRLDGEHFPMEVSIGEMVFADEKVLIATCRDLTTQKKAAAQLENARMRLQEAIQSISEGFVLYDAQDRIMLCNQKYRQIIAEGADPVALGWDFEAAIRQLARSGRIASAKDDAEGWIEDRIARHGNPGVAYEEALGDGTHLRVSEYRTHEGGVVGIYADVTALKRREERLIVANEKAQTASRAKSEFLRTMSHELRTPLNAIIGFSEIIKTELLGPLENKQYVKYAKDIHGSGSHLLSILNDILDLASIEAGKHKLKKEDFDVGDAVEFCVRMIAWRASAADQTISVSLPDELPLLHADEKAFKQVLINLLSNAVKFTERGGAITVEVAMMGAGLAVQVTDTGIGMAEKDIPKALEPFGQIDGRVERRFEGTGLGLPIAKSIMELHGGTLKLKSSVDRGTSATIWFPSKRGQRPGAAHSDGVAAGQ